MVEAGLGRDGHHCDPDRLRARADRLIADRGWAWPPTVVLTPDELVEECAMLGIPLEVGRYANSRTSGMPEAIELLVSTFHDEIARSRPRLAELLRACVVVVTGRSGRPHGVSTPYKGEGIVVFLDGAMLLLFADMVRHAMTLINESTERHLFVDWPAPSTVRAAASLIWSFRQPSRGFNRDDLPSFGKGLYNGSTAFGKLLWFGERFLIGHELVHALYRLEAVSDAPWVRETIRRNWPDLPAESVDDWTEELSADLLALNLVADSAVGIARPVAVASCLLAAAYLSMLERTMAISPRVPFPIQPDELSRHLPSFKTHPPAEMRIDLLMSTKLPDTAVQMAEIYTAAMSTLQAGLYTASDGNCIAPTDVQGWCMNPRGPAGLFCSDHGRRQ